MDGGNILAGDAATAREAITALMDATDKVCDAVRYTAYELHKLNEQTRRIQQHIHECGVDL